MRTLFNKLPKPYFPHLCTVNNKRVPENAWKVLGIQAYHVVRACYFYWYFFPDIMIEKARKEVGDLFTGLQPQIIFLMCCCLLIDNVLKGC